MRLHVFLAKAGIASRRKSEQYISEGLVSVNGKRVTGMGVQIDPQKDKVLFNGKPVQIENEIVCIALYKPRGVVTTMQRGKETGPVIQDFLEVPVRVFPVGRLDKDSEGLIILTNDGEIALKLGHPRYEHEKEYRVAVDKTVTDAHLKRLSRPFFIDGYRTRPAQVSKIDDKEFTIVLKEGRKRQIRRMCEMAGLQVVRLMRTRIGSVAIGNMRPGQSKTLSAKTVKDMLHDTNS
ncbi:MAG: pseudouridine synthase [bacterium]|nr:pseudouridine synthase [bacterium]